MKDETKILILCFLASPCAFIGLIFSQYMFNYFGHEFVTNYFWYCLIAGSLVMLSFALLPIALAKDIDNKSCRSR